MTSHRRREWHRTALGVLILVLLAATAFQNYRYTQCQSDYNVQFAAALTERSNAADDRNVAQNHYLSVINGLKDGDPRRVKARSQYIADLADADARRKAAPIPTNPRC